MSAPERQVVEWWASESDLIEATIRDLKEFQEKLRADRRQLVKAGTSKKSDAVSSLERREFEIGYRLRSWERYVKVIELRENPLLVSADVKQARALVKDIRPARKKARRRVKK